MWPFLTFRHAEQLIETVCQRGPKAHAPETSDICHVQWRDGPVSSLPAPHSRLVSQGVCWDPLHCSGSDVTAHSSLLPLRAPDGHAEDEPQCCCFRPDLLNVSCSAVADFFPPPHISLAYHGHRVGMFPPFSDELTFLRATRLVKPFLPPQIRIFTRLEKMLQSEKDISK